MIYPMMLQIDFSSIKYVRKNPKGLILTVVVNWLIKPFTMAFFAWIFFSKIYGAFISPELAGEYIAGAILLGAAPCTAMVFVWSYLSDGDPTYTLVQVSVNDLIILIAFIPIVGLLLGITNISIPYETLAASVGNICRNSTCSRLCHKQTAHQNTRRRVVQNHLPPETQTGKHTRTASHTRATLCIPGTKHSGQPRSSYCWPPSHL